MSGNSKQLGFDLGDRQARTSYEPDVGEVRAELLEILAVARAAREEAPWDRRTQRYHATVFPQMARWLPEEEARQLCLEFGAELERIERLLAA